MDEFSYELKIPRDRVAVLIGKSGEIKKKIEDETHTRLDIDSKEGDVFLCGKDALGLFSAREIVKAIARGFNPDIALLLLKPDYVYEPIRMSDYAKTKNDMARLKGRVIGREGRSRKLIEEYTETYISVYGKTIAVIGEAQDVMNARKAIESLLKGSPHSVIYKWLEKKRRERTKQSIEELALKKDSA